MALAYQPVISSFVKAVAYDPATRTMGVRHLDGSEIHYQDVSKETHKGVMRARSTGGYLHEHVRGKHKHIQLK